MIVLDSSSEERLWAMFASAAASKEYNSNYDYSSKIAEFADGMIERLRNRRNPWNRIESKKSDDVSPKKIKVYISGPISGIPDGNRKAFSDVELSLNLAGFDAVNPHGLTDNLGLTNSANEKPDWKECMKIDIRALLDCDRIVFLPGWENSKGANLEKMIAESLSIPVLEWK